MVFAAVMYDVVRQYPSGLGREDPEGAPPLAREYQRLPRCGRYSRRADRKNNPAKSRKVEVVAPRASIALARCIAIQR